MDTRNKKVKQKKQDGFKLLAEETVLNIFSFFNTKDLVKLGEVCRRFNNISQLEYRKRYPLLDFKKPVATKRLQGIQHDNPIIKMTALTDTLLIGWHDSEIIILDISNAETFKTLHSALPSILYAQPRINLVKLADKKVAALYLKTMRIFNYETGKLVKEIQLPHKYPRSCTALSDTLLVIAYNFGILEIWNYKTGHRLQTIQSLSRSNVCCTAKLNDNQFFSGHLDGNIRIWDVQTGKGIKKLRSNIKVEFLEAVQSMVVFPNHLLASGHANGCIKIWNYKKGICLQTLGDELGNNSNAKPLYLAKLSEKHLLQLNSGGKMEIWHYDQGLFTKSFKKPSELGPDILDCVVFNNNKIILSKKTSLEVISFPAIKNTKTIEVEEEPTNKKCFIM